MPFKLGNAPEKQWITRKGPSVDLTGTGGEIAFEPPQHRPSALPTMGSWATSDYSTNLFFGSPKNAVAYKQGTDLFTKSNFKISPPVTPLRPANPLYPSVRSVLPVATAPSTPLHESFMRTCLAQEATKREQATQTRQETLRRKKKVEEKKLRRKTADARYQRKLKLREEQATARQTARRAMKAGIPAHMPGLLDPTSKGVAHDLFTNQLVVGRGVRDTQHVSNSSPASLSW